MTAEINKLKVKEFLSRFFRTHDLGDDEDIFETGFVNSLFAMQLVMFVENEFKITVEDEDLDVENFRTANTIVQFVNRKTASLIGA